MTNERTNAELIKAIRDEDKGLGGHAMLSARIIHNTAVVMQAAYIEQKHGKGADVAMEWITNHLDNCDCLPEEECIGGGNLDNANNPELFFRDNHLSGELSPYQSRMAPLIDELERRMECLQKRMDLMTAERDHWKANHNSRVNAAKVLMDRTDMPLERVGAYKQYVAALEANHKLQDALIAAETELAKLRKQKPVAWDCGGSITANSGYAEWFSRKDHGAAVPLYTSPVPAPAVLKCWLIATDPKMKNPNCQREPIAKCASGFCINEKAGRGKCRADHLLDGRPSRAEKLPKESK